jgi:hypothetical protein
MVGGGGRVWGVVGCVWARQVIDVGEIFFVPANFSCSLRSPARPPSEQQKQGTAR